MELVCNRQTMQILFAHPMRQMPTHKKSREMTQSEVYSTIYIVFSHLQHWPPINSRCCWHGIKVLFVGGWRQERSYMKLMHVIAVRCCGKTCLVIWKAVRELDSFSSQLHKTCSQYKGCRFKLKYYYFKQILIPLGQNCFRIYRASPRQRCGLAIFPVSGCCSVISSH